jgi:hypothetical protein
MARLLSVGLQSKSVEASNNLGVVESPGTFAQNGGTGTVNGTLDTVLFRTGGASWQFVTAASTFTALAELDIAARGANTSVTYFIRAYVNITTKPTTTSSILSPANTNSASIRLTSAGVVQLWNDSAGTQVGSNGPTLSTGIWYGVELGITFNASSQMSAIEGRVDQVTFASTSGLTAAGPTVVAIWLGFSSSTGTAATINVDDVAVNDSTGSNQTSWPGSGKILLLLPTSDNSAGSWKAGSAASASSNGALFDGINNTPPIGTATPLAVTAGISNNVSGATNPNGDFNMTTYTAAGIGAADTINAITMIIVHGEDISTGAKTGSFTILSNPAQSGTDTIGSGNTSQFGPSAGGAVGTYPTNWAAQQGTVQYPGSVTVGTAPVCRITKVDTGTRAADCCFMGLYVDYTPAVVQIPYVNPMPPLIAQ